MLEYAMIALLGLSLFLFFISFFAKDDVKQIEEQLDQLTLSFAQETYQLKKRLQVLEEELLIRHESPPHIAPAHDNDRSAFTKNRVFTLYKQGLSYEQIARETALTTEEVRMILRGLAR
ncbi:MULTISPECIES: hypothetical protein [Parageobacillus]|jgi:hypothetical protein|uniref:RNA polymerase sigma factor 70 region 4 type 2 domain-containing protein n=1 Tax=Parageobacillus thermoglucosidasius TaxID=1426 RepID=A0A1B7KWP2_PARTM|nr:MULTISPECIES: hypothetical protein [Parageobacillus]OAT74512.1 hypothetical protein A7K69_02020 [Parageobacillus thermoglucosidasius]BDG46514.1 hypothetical protein PspKH34_10750 [Parageobacillus sp. KH3-4]